MRHRHPQAFKLEPGHSDPDFNWKITPEPNREDFWRTHRANSFSQVLSLRCKIFAIFGWISQNMGLACYQCGRVVIFRSYRTHQQDYRRIVEWRLSMVHPISLWWYGPNPCWLLPVSFPTTRPSNQRRDVHQHPAITNINIRAPVTNLRPSRLSSRKKYASARRSGKTGRRKRWAYPCE